MVSISLLVFGLSSASAGVDPPEVQQRVLQFESPGWSASDPDKVEGDTEIFHGGERSLRLTSEGSTYVTRSYPVRVEGKTVELRGFLKTDAVEGFAGLWLRQDGAQRGLAFDNMEKQKFDGTRDWTEVRVVLPLHPDTRDIYFGAIVMGQGTAWVDDLELLVDGEPIWDVPVADHLLTIFDRDTAFDDGSEIDIADLSHVQHDNLVRLGKVWGFLKYHHPKPRAGAVHWDYELFRVLPELLAATDTDHGRQILAQWVEALGDVPPCDPCAVVPDDLALPIQVEWIEDSADLGEDLSRLLTQIHERRPKTGEQFYVRLNRGVGNPDFSIEARYRDLETLDTGYRLLALYRFWNIIAYWFPYRDLIDADWDQVLAEAIWESVAAEDEAAFAVALIRVMAQVSDTHTNLWGSLDHRPPGGECRVPAEVRFVEEDRAVVWFLPEQADGTLEVGDVILAVDGVPVSESIVDWAPLFAASNRPTQLRDMGRSLLIGPCGEASLTLERGEVEVSRIEYRDARTPSRDRPGEAFQIIDGDIAYLKLGEVVADDVPSYLKRARGTSGWVLDLRNYPSDFVVFDLGRRLVAERASFVRFTHASLDNPSAFRWGSPLHLKPKGRRYPGKIAILVDEVTQSSAEYHAMAFRAAPDAVVFGSTTAGADGNISAIPLPGSFRSVITGIGVFYPDRTPTQRVGIVPDVEVRPTVEGIRAGRDEVLEAAITHLRAPVQEP